METKVLCFSRLANTTRLKSISKKGLSSELKLATDKGKHHVMEAEVLCFSRMANTTRLKSISIITTITNYYIIP